ncbi:MAG: signal peptidase I [Elusimicrobia bacterium]|nr:signal peptidase I [Candidatus Obscuribacterium magneticum]
MRRILLLLILGAAGAYLVRAYVIEGIYIASGSMDPTLYKGRHLLVDKLSLRFRQPRRGEIVVFKTPQGPNKDLVKRVIAIENDVIGIEKKMVILNNKRLNESYVQHLRSDVILEDDNMIPIRIPSGFVFVMGDNRDYSLDSRDWVGEDGKTWSPYVSVGSLKGIVMGVK